jgi:hypothetical protein
VGGERWSALKDRGLVLGLAAAIAATGLWYWHADATFHRTGLSQAIWHPSGNYGPPISSAAGPFVGIYHWATKARLEDPAFYNDMLTRTWALHLTPAGFSLAVFARLRDVAVAPARIVDVWLGIVLLFVLVTAEGNIHHEFHQLPMLPPAALLFGLAAAPAFDGAWLRAVGGRLMGPLGSAVTLVAIAVLSFNYSGVVQNFFRPDRLDMIPIDDPARAIQRGRGSVGALVTVGTRSNGTTRRSCCIGRTAAAGASTRRRSRRR